MLKTIGLLFVAFVFAYFLFYPFIKRYINGKKVFRWFIIAYIISVIISTIATYVL